MTSGHTLRTRIAQMDVLPGCPRKNTDKMLSLICDAVADQVDLIVFPEMAIPGYLIGDEWEHTAFLRECEACGESIRNAANNITVVFGNVGIDWNRRNEDGRTRKYNALFIAENMRFIGPESGPYPFTIKTLLPNYRQFDDSRHFFDLRKLAFEENAAVESLMGPVKTKCACIGCILCEDAWDMDYAVSPLSVLASHTEIDLFINASSSPFTLNKNHKRNRVFSAHAVKLGRPLIYVNNVGIQNNGKTVFTFDGASSIYDSKGNHIRCGEPFEETTLTVDMPLNEASFADLAELPEDTVADIHRAIQYGTSRFMEMCGLSRVTIGVSGGIDSAVVAAVYSQILSPDNLLLVNMPSQYNSDTTKNLAKTLADNVGCYYADVPISKSTELTHSQIDGLQIKSNASSKIQSLRLSNFMMENVQARDRSSRILAAIASSFGGVFTCNANKSEITVGYTTIYGDLGGYLANIGDLWKTQVYQLAEYINKEVFIRELIPRGSIDIPPSAELCNAHNVDEGKGDPLIYKYHDLLFKSWVEWWERARPEDIMRSYISGTLDEDLGYEGKIKELFPNNAAFVNDLECWWNQYQGMGLAKRIQAPPILAVKRRAFGFDHREAQMGPQYTDEYAKLKKQALRA